MSCSPRNSSVRGSPWLHYMLHLQPRPLKNMEGCVWSRYLGSHEVGYTTWAAWGVRARWIWTVKQFWPWFAMIALYATSTASSTTKHGGNLGVQLYVFSKPRGWGQGRVRLFWPWFAMIALYATSTASSTAKQEGCVKVYRNPLGWGTRAIRAVRGSWGGPAQQL